jgi:small subunit ribosomal protein S20
MRRIVTERHWVPGLQKKAASQKAAMLFREACTIELQTPCRDSNMAPFSAAPGSKEDLMANIASAKKRARQAENRRAHNVGQRTELRSAIKNVKKAIAAGDKKAAQAQFQVSQSRIDSIADKRIVRKNTVSRQKSRLAAAIKAMP